MQVAANPTGALPSDSYGGLTGTNYYNDAYNFSTGAFASNLPTNRLALALDGAYALKSALYTRSGDVRLEARLSFSY